jgi:hypothetical protein
MGSEGMAKKRNRVHDSWLYLTIGLPFAVLALFLWFHFWRRATVLVLKHLLQ